MAFTGQNGNYTSVARHMAVTPWAAGTGYSVGNIRRPTYQSTTYTVTVASPAVFTWKDNAGSALTHNFAAGDSIVFSGGTPPTGFTNGTTYYVIATGLTANAFELSATPGGSAIACTGAPTSNVATGVHNGSERIFVCTVAGTSAATLEPVWGAAPTRGVAVTDNTVTWSECTGVPGVNGDITNTPTWLAGAKSTTVTIGHIIKDGTGTFLLICTTGGAAGTGVEPTWASTSPFTKTDNVAHWTMIAGGTGQTAIGSLTKWGAPHARIVSSMATNWGDVGRYFYYGDDHVEEYTLAVSVTWTGRGSIGLPVFQVSVDHTGSMPPVTADLKAGATWNVHSGPGNTTATLSGTCYKYGFTFNIASGSSGGINFPVDGDANAKYYENCAFNMLSSGNTSSISANNQLSHVIYDNVTVQFSAIGQKFNPFGYTLWKNTPNMITLGTAPTVLFGPNSGTLMIDGCDLSNLGGGSVFDGSNISVPYDYTVKDCKIAATTKISTVVPTTYAPRLRAIRVSNTTNRAHSELYTGAGTLNTIITTYLANGAALDGQPFCWQFTSSVRACVTAPLQPFPIVVQNTVATPADLTLTVYGQYQGSALPTQNDLWLEVAYEGDASSTISTWERTRTDFLLSTTPGNLTADSSDWTGAVSARVNSHTYAVGDLIITAGNSSRVFYCTVAGAAAGSEPGGYASATDGSTAVVDGAASFQALVRFKVTITLTAPQPQLSGLLYVYPFVGKASSIYWLDPKVN